MDETRYFLRAMRYAGLGRIGISTTEALFELIRQGEATSRQIADALGISHEKALNQVARLQKEGLADVVRVTKQTGTPNGFSTYTYKPTLKAGRALGL